MRKGRGPESDGYVFRREDGRKLSQTRLNQQHAEVRKLLKLPADFVVHSLRHTMLARLGEAGVDAFTIMKIVGYSSVPVSQRYVHPSPESVERAFERLDSLNHARRDSSGEAEKSKVGTELGTHAIDSREQAA